MKNLFFSKMILIMFFFLSCIMFIVKIDLIYGEKNITASGHMKQLTFNYLLRYIAQVTKTILKK